MSAAARLFPTMVLMAFVSACSPAAEDHADAAVREKGGQSPPVAPVAERTLAKAPSSTTVELRERSPSVPRAIAVRDKEVAPSADHGDLPRIGPSPYPLDLPPAADLPDLQPFPDEVTRFMVDRDGCDHFRGEEPYDAERRAYLTESIAELCTGTDVRLADLRQRYARDPDVMAALRGYEDRIESGTD